MKRIVELFEKNIIKIAVILAIFGFIIIVIFSIFLPFNDWSFQLNSELFGQYGSFIGGLAGSIFSLSAMFLLYETLKLQKRTVDIEDFERTFFNLLKTQQELTEGIRVYSFTLNNDFNKVSHKAYGREFFQFARHDLKFIWKNLTSKDYLGMFDGVDSEEFQYIYHKLELIKSSDEVPNCDKDLQVKEILTNYKLKYANYFYGFSKEKHEEANLEDIDDKRKVEILYELFFQEYHYAIGHYFRHLYNIIKFVKQNEEKLKSAKVDSITYIAFIQAQMSSYELMLVYYNAFLFLKLRQYIIDYDFLENLSIEDLIDESHNNIYGVKLKRRQEFTQY
ncbi:MAG: putative phage abortive infection protein [Bacteroidales bacterium]|nr:putative phage abortive infection protein [Bacteroidales bacterium]MCF8455208.1 putative phage abortive infection protein [Bacteroidales bacterium]